MSFAVHRLKSCLAVTIMLLRWGWEGMCNADKIESVPECIESRREFCTYHVQSQDDGVRCLADCGVAIVKDAVPIHVVDIVLGQWKALEHNKKRHDLFSDQNSTESLQGGRTETMPPFTRGFNDSRMFAADKVTGIVNGYARHLGVKASGWPQLHTYLLLDAPPGCATQKWHQDAFHNVVEGIKVQIPLVDITANMGPAQLLTGSHRSGGLEEVVIDREIKKGKTVYGNVTRGTAIVYLHTISHRGLANPSKIRRRAIDLSYQSVPHGDEEDYMGTFKPGAQKAMRRYADEYRKYLPNEGFPIEYGRKGYDGRFEL